MPTVAWIAVATLALVVAFFAGMQLEFVRGAGHRTEAWDALMRTLADLPRGIDQQEWAAAQEVKAAAERGLELNRAALTELAKH